MNNTVQKASQDEVEIDLGEIVFVLLHKAAILIASLLAGAVLAFGVTKLLITPQYTASSMIYIFTKTTSITSLADLQIGSQLTVDFQTLGTSRPVVEQVIRELNLDTTYEELLSTITITNPTNSRILKISVENPDPQLAADISNAMAESLSDRVAEVLNTDKPSTVEQAVVPDKPSSPSTKKNTAIGALLGLVAAAAVVLLQHFMDDTIKNEEDVRKYLGLNTLAAVPLEHGAVRQGRITLPGARQHHRITDASAPSAAKAPSAPGKASAAPRAAAPAKAPARPSRPIDTAGAARKVNFDE
jgi:capsular polysaccharide biosynthesis protein